MSIIDKINAVFRMFGQGIPCLFQWLTGFYCPGCGGTRSAKYLFYGDILQSLQYHPLVPYMALIAVMKGGSLVLAYVWDNPKLSLKRYDVFVYIGIGIILVNWIWKNYMLVVRGIDLLP